MLQRLRDAEDDIRFGEFSGKEGDIISGRHPAGPQPRRRDGRPRQARGAAAARRAGARARSTSTAPGSSAWWSRSARACAARRSPCRARTPTWSRSCSRSRSPRSPTAPSRSRRSPARPATAPRSRCKSDGPGVNAKGACIGPMGQRVRNVMSELHGEKIDIVDWSDDPAELVAHALSPAQVTLGRGRRRRGRGRRGWSCPTSSSRWRSARRARTPASPPGSPAGGSTSAPTRRPAERAGSTAADPVDDQLGHQVVVVAGRPLREVEDREHQLQRVRRRARAAAYHLRRRR